MNAVDEIQSRLDKAMREFHATKRHNPHRLYLDGLTDGLAAALSDLTGTAALDLLKASEVRVVS